MPARVEKCVRDVLVGRSVCACQALPASLVRDGESARVFLCFLSVCACVSVCECV